MLFKSQASEQEVTLQMTPLIDMVFLLLIFFLVATTFHQVEREMEIALPIAQSGSPISMALREIVINVVEDGTIIVAGKPTTPAALGELIESAVASNPEQKVTVRGDRAAAYGHVVKVLDICKTNGIQEPYLDTVLE